MKFAQRLLFLCGVLLAALAGPASAQYMFLDSDGDGLPGAGDVMQANGVVTNVGVYLYTNRDRVGTTRTCQDLTIDLFSFAVNLQATGGTVDYGTFAINPHFNTNLASNDPNNGSTIYVSYANGSGIGLAEGGPHQLFTIPVTGQTLSPKLDIVINSGISGADPTYFGTHCTGDFTGLQTWFLTDDLQQFDGEWTDRDGLAAAGGVVNEDPVLAAIGNKSVNEGALLSFTATATDADIPAQTLTFSLTLGAPAATGAAITAGGDFTWTPTEAQGPGVYPITIAVSDGAGGSDDELINVTVNEVNQLPTLNAVGNKTINEGALLSFLATAQDLDTPPNTITFSLTLGSPAATGAVISPGGSFTWTPTEAQGPGVYPITIAVSDGAGGTDNELINVTVNEVNQAPVLAAIGNKTVNEGALLSFTATATDADLPAQTLTFTLTLGSPAATGAAITAGGNFTWTPSNSQGGAVYPITIIVTDDGTPPMNDTELIDVTVNEGANTNPVLAAIGDKTVNEGALLSFTATATDADLPAQTLTFSLTLGSPAATGAAITAGGDFTWTPTEAQGPGVYPITVNVSDGVGGTDNELIQVTVNEVNQAPVLAAIGNKTVSESSLLSFTATATDADLPAQTLTFTLTLGSPAATGAAITAGGNFTWTPDATQGGSTYPITIVVSDGALTDDELIQVTVTEGANTAPVLAAIGNKTVNEGVLLSFTATATDADTPPQTLTFSLTLGAPAATGAAITAGGDFTWTPTEAQGPGVYPITIEVADGVGGTDNELIEVTVNEVNVAPILAAIGNQLASVGAELAFTATATDADLPPNTLTFTLGAAPAGAAITAGGNFTWTPAGTGTFPATIIVTDNGTPTLNDSETFDIEVGAVNANPILGAIGNKTVNEEVLLSFTATATDSDDPPQTLTFSLTLGSPAATGAAITAGGDFTWTPTEAQGPGVYPITIAVSDGAGGSDNELIEVTVNELNAAPVLAAIGNKTVNEEVLLSFTATATDADLPAQTLTFTLTLGSPAATGAAITAGGNFTWTPTEAQGGDVYPITIVVSDGSLTDDELIQVTVNDVNVAPVLAAIGDKVALVDTELFFQATATDADIPTNILTFSLGAGAPSGSGIDPDDGEFRWTPGAGDIGTHVATILVTDNGIPELNDSETIEITVTAENRPPTLTQPVDMTVDEGATADQQLSGSDPDNDPLTFAKVTGPTFMTVSTLNPTTGNVHLAPGFADAGTHPASASASDGVLTDTKSFTINVNNVNRPPVADAGGPYVGTINVDVSFDGTGSSDPDGDTLTYGWTFGDGANGTGATPMHAYTATGTFDVTLTVSDGLLNDSDATTARISESAAANAFFIGGNKTTRLGSGKPTTCVQIEPAGGAFSTTDIDLNSIVMTFGGGQISAISGKTVVDSDKNGNGIQEIEACFSKEDLRTLFASLPSGDNQVDVVIEGALLSGAEFSATTSHRVVVSGKPQVSASPNPFNPETAITFSITQAGRVTAQIHDISGRLVRTLEDRDLESGVHTLHWNGSTNSGGRVASGIYFFKLRSKDGDVVQRLTVMK